MQQARRDLALKKYSGNTDMDLAKRRSIQLQREADVVDCGGAVHQAKLLAKASGCDRMKIRPRGNYLADQLRIGVQQRLAIRIQDGCVVDKRPKRDLCF